MAQDAQIIVYIEHIRSEVRLPWYSHKIQTVCQIVKKTRDMFPEDDIERLRIAFLFVDGRRIPLSPTDVLQDIPHSGPGMKIRVCLAPRGTARPLIPPYEHPKVDDEDFFAWMRRPIPTSVAAYIKQSCPTVWDDTTLECAICLDDTSIQDFRRIPICDHKFHLDCLIRWLSKKPVTCPLCRKKAEIK